MTSQLPSKPDLHQLKNQAKDILKAHKAGDLSCCGVLRELSHLAAASDEQVLAATVQLKDVQFALAKRYGFASWRALKEHLLPRPGPAIARDGSRTWIEGMRTYRLDQSSWVAPQFAIMEVLELLGESHTTLTRDGQEVFYPKPFAFGGAAFALCHASHWQGCAHLFSPTNVIANLAEAYGYDYSFTGRRPHPDQEARDHTRDVFHRICGEIDAERPVLVSGAAISSGTLAIAIGYDRDDMALCLLGLDETHRWSPVRGVADPLDRKRGPAGYWDGDVQGPVLPGLSGGRLQNPAFLIGPKQEDPPSLRQNVINALRRAAELHHAKPYHVDMWGGVTYYFGQQAFEQWAQDLRQLDYLADLENARPADSHDWYRMANMNDQVDQLNRGRLAAILFYEWAVDIVPEARRGLSAAHEAHWEVLRKVARDDCPLGLFSHVPDERHTQWLSDRANCEAGADAIERMLAAEQRAIAGIEQALVVLN